MKKNNHIIQETTDRDGRFVNTEADKFIADKKKRAERYKKNKEKKFDKYDKYM